MLPFGLQQGKNLKLDRVQSCHLPSLSDCHSNHLRKLRLGRSCQSCHHLEVPHLFSLLPPILPLLSSLLTVSQLPPHFTPLIFPPPKTHKITYLSHCSQVPRGPNFVQNGEIWGPNFEYDGDLMGTFASRNGDPKSVFLKIDQNKPLYIYQHVEVFEYSSKKFNFTDKLA